MRNIIDEIIKFRDDRNWEQFHNAKDLALAISIEAAELNELFLWTTHDMASTDRIKEELADILIYSFTLAHKYGFDIEDIIREKMEKNEVKYPVLNNSQDDNF